MVIMFRASQSHSQTCLGMRLTIVSVLSASSFHPLVHCCSFKKYLILSANVYIIDELWITKGIYVYIVPVAIYTELYPHSNAPQLHRKYTRTSKTITYTPTSYVPMVKAIVPLSKYTVQCTG